MELYQVKCLIDDGVTKKVKLKFVFAHNSIEASKIVLDFWSTFYDTIAHTISVIKVSAEENIVFDSDTDFTLKDLTK